MTTLVLLVPGLATVVSYSAQSVLVANTTMGANGGFIMNPLTAQDQGLPVAEPLYINLLGPASVSEGGLIGTIAIQPGQSYVTPPNTDVWVNAISPGHQFTAYFASPYTVPYPPGLVPGIPGAESLSAQIFPPPGVTGLTDVIPSYLYQEYSDDDDLQGFVAAQNDCQQDYVDTFNALNLPIYPGPVVSGKLLDWVAQGLYGIPRPALSSGITISEGPLNTWGPNFLIPTENANIDGYGQATDEAVVVSDDDTYRRVITWHFYKGDGKYFSTRWLKRRIWRFLYGTNGISPDPHAPGYSDNDSYIADTEQISISFGPNRECTIRLVLGNRTVVGGAMLNTFGPNGFGPLTTPFINNFVPIPLNDVESTYQPLPALPYMYIFQEAINSGVLELPYQFQFKVVIG